MVFQESSLLGRRVRENLHLSLQLDGIDTAENVDQRIKEAMSLGGADLGWLDHDASQLSVGQKQRVTLARALVTVPDILLLDEPTASLDIQMARGLLDWITALRLSRSLTIVMATHRLHEARQLGGRMLVLVDGRVAVEGDAATLAQNPPNETVRSFLAGSDKWWSVISDGCIEPGRGDIV